MDDQIYSGEDKIIEEKANEEGSDEVNREEEKD